MPDEQRREKRWGRIKFLLMWVGIVGLGALIVLAVILHFLVRMGIKIPWGWLA